MAGAKFAKLDSAAGSERLPSDDDTKMGETEPTDIPTTSRPTSQSTIATQIPSLRGLGTGGEEDADHDSDNELALCDDNTVAPHVQHLDTPTRCERPSSPAVRATSTASRSLPTQTRSTQRSMARMRHCASLAGKRLWTWEVLQNAKA
ncbi:hypothetical protein LTR86_006615 [Recurvomyces mirabilis]|nr:hypothetical protein LTR86_006615 [Recurvomyces mirabilis]